MTFTAFVFAVALPAVANERLDHEWQIHDEETNEVTDRVDDLDFLKSDLPEDHTESFFGTEPETRDDEISNKSLIGINKLRKITNTNRVPNRMVGHLSNGCTATVVSYNHVLTAAHCVYNFKTKTWKKNLKFIPGRNGSNVKPYGEWKIRRKIASKKYTQEGKIQWDVAIGIVKEKNGTSVGEYTGWMSFGYKNSLSVNNKVNILGYPGNKPTGTQWSAFCPIKKIQSQYMYHNCDTAPGNSGSPMYSYSQEEGKRIIRGVHTNGFKDGQTKLNSGPRINKTLFELLNRWVIES